MKTSEPPVIVTAEINAPVSEVWKAITELPLMTQWYFENIPEFKAEVGFKTSFAVHNEGRTFTHVWKVVTVEKEKQISYKWKYPEYPGDSVVHFTLESKGDTTLITVKAVVLEDFPDDIPEFKWESCNGGWNYFIPGRLKDFLEKNNL